MHWLVDGMNVIGSRPDGWWKDRRAAMEQLVAQLEAWAARALTDDDEITVVFEKPLSPPIASSRITVAHAPAAAPNSADDEIVRLVSASPRPSDIRVATSDGVLADRVVAAGASVYPARRFRALIDR